MHRIKLLPTFVLLTLLGAGITMGMGQPDWFMDSQEGRELALRESNNLVSRAESVSAALAQNDLFDCAVYIPDAKPVLPAERQIFHTVQNIKVTPDDGNEYLGAVWSPRDDAMVFVVQTNGRREITDHDALPSDSKTRLMAVGTSKLLLYFPARNSWERIAADGMRPVWSLDSQKIYYMTGTDLMRFDLNTRRAIHTGSSAPNTGAGLLFSRPLSDGRFLAPRHPHAPLEVQGSQTPALRQIGVAESDYVLLSPRGDLMIVAYGTNTYRGQFTPAVTVLHRSNGEATSLFKNCQYSAVEMAWSPAGDKVAYPIHAERPEIRIYDVQSQQTQVLVRLDTFEHLGGLSWSPDSKYLAFTYSDDRSIWVVSTDGVLRQQLVKGGLLPNWSPDGKQILYARPGAKRLLDWYLLKVNPLVGAKGE